MNNYVKFEKDSTQMVEALGDRFVLIDTCSVLRPSMLIFAGRFMVNSAFCKTKLILLEGLLEELNRKKNSKELGGIATQGLKLLEHMGKHGFCKIIKGFTDKGFFDRQVKSFLSYYASSNKIAIITEDSGLAYDSLMVNDNGIVTCEQVTVYRLGDDGALYAWKFN